MTTAQRTVSDLNKIKNIYINLYRNKGFQGTCRQCYLTGLQVPDNDTLSSEGRGLLCYNMDNSTMDHSGKCDYRVPCTLKTSFVDFQKE